jgi:uncharacterized membrane protein YuzA (DUF378 family)
MKSKCSFLDYLAMLLVVIGALSWGLVGLFDFNFVEFFFGSMPIVVKIIYIVVGIAGVYALFGLLRCKKSCSS